MLYSNYDIKYTSYSEIRVSLFWVWLHCLDVHYLPEHEGASKDLGKSFIPYR